MKRIIENWEKFIAEELPDRTTAADFRAHAAKDRGLAGSATGVDDKERNLLLTLQTKLASAAKVGNINTGNVLRLAKLLSAELDTLLAKSQKKE